MTASAFSAFRSRVQAQMETFFPATIKLGEVATEYAAATTGLRRSEDAASLGTFNLKDDDITFRVRKDILPTAPQSGVLTWVERNLRFRIIRAKLTDETDPAWLIGCEALVK